MPHTLWPVKFNPARSAYWLPAPGQRAAARMRTDWFWALRISLEDPDNREPILQTSDPRPPWLFVVATNPSPYPNVPKASFTLGPRIAIDTGTVVGHDAELLVHENEGPLPSLERLIHEPIYLHTIPALRLNRRACPPLDICCFALEEESLHTFISGVRESFIAAEEYRDHALETYGYNAIKNGWAAPTTNAGRVSFGEGLNDPHTYIFDLKFPKKIPCFERPSFVYEDLMLYRQLCVDYRWKGAEPAIEWVVDMRQVAREGRAVSSTCMTSIIAGPLPCLDLDSELRSYAVSLFEGRRKHRNGAHDNEGNSPSALSSGPCPAASPSESSEVAKSISSRTYSSDSSSEVLAWIFSELPYYYPICPFSKPKVIAFDLFGTILDRQGGIAQALSAIRPRVPSMSTVNVDVLVERYITLEALEAHRSETTGSPTSLATLARRALLNLLHELGLHVHEHDSILSDALKHILYPKPYADVQRAVEILVRRGYRLVCLPVHSETTMQQLRACVPDVFADYSVLWTNYVSIHATAERMLLRGFASFCGALVGRSDALPNEDILVVSSSIGRVLHCAVYHFLTTAHTRRPGNLEGTVNFVVGTVEENATPVPSLVVSGLDELCAKLDT